jgi:type II secretory pathway pseudopilin PulG
MRRGSAAPRRAAGFSYLGLLALVALIGILLAAAGEVTRTATQREREAELLWVGHQYRDAIGRYLATNHRYPAQLADLLGGTLAGGEGGAGAAGASSGSGMSALTFRAIRRLYRDPMTNATDWTPVPSPDGSIMGVASSSTRAPIKKAGFEDDDAAFVDAESYAAWQFVYQPPALQWRKQSASTSSN